MDFIKEWEGLEALVKDGWVNITDAVVANGLKLRHTADHPGSVNVSRTQAKFDIYLYIINYF